MIAGLMLLLDGVVCTRASEPRSSRRPSSRWPPVKPRQGASQVEIVPDPHTALARARELAGREGSVLIGGSLYLLEDLSDVLGGAGRRPSDQ